MANARRKRDLVAEADEAETKKFAGLALEQFRAAKGRALKLCGEEKKTKRDVLGVLRRYYDKLCSDYLRASPATTYQGWLDHGPKCEWDELEACAADDAAWDGLVERYERREHVN